MDLMVYVNGVVWLAASLQGITGFGFMMLAVPGLILRLPAHLAVPTLILIYLPLGAAQTFQLRRDVDWRVLAVLLPSAVVSLPLGAWVLAHAPTKVMEHGIGLVMMGLAVLLLMKPGPPFRREGAARVGAGLISGVLAASTSVSGPPVVLLGLKQRWDAAQFRATLLTYFLGVALCCLPFHWEMNLLSRTNLIMAGWGLPGTVLGFATSTWLRGHVHGPGFRWLAVGLVLCGGLAAVIL